MEKTNNQGALQQPIGSGFSATTTAEEIIRGIDLSGKIAIVTGGNTGIGLKTAQILADAGARVIVPARDMEKARKNLKGLEGIELEHMDLMDPTSIDAFADRFLASGRPLHLLINNAGIMWVPLERDSRGLESHIIRTIDPSIDQVLANFDAPGKVDLINFMQRNFMFNMSLEKLGFLTGRSLSAFNRDFKKLFNTTPQRWLTDKRLELAYYHLSEKKKKPTEVYLEVGFEDLSHFSFSFKKKYGVSPNQLHLRT